MLLTYPEDGMIADGADSEPKWRKATYSTGNGACVEVTSFNGVLAIRDSQDQDGPIVVCEQPTWQGFVSAIRAAKVRGL